MEKKDSIGVSAGKLTVSKFVALFVTMLSAMLLSRFRSVEEYGTYSELLLVVNLVITIIMMGLPNSLNYFLGRADTTEEKDRFLSVYYSVSTILSVVVGAVLVFCTPFLVSYFKNPEIKNFIYFLAIFPWTKIICASIENVLVAYNKANTIMLFRISNSVCLLLIILIVKFFSLNFYVYMLFFLGVEVAFSIWVYIIVRGVSDKFKFLIDKNLIHDILVFSIPIGLASTVGTLNAELDKFVIGGLMDTESLAVYTNASKEMPFTIIATSITAVLLPRLAKMLKEKRTDDAISLWGYALKISYICMCFFAFALIVFSPEVMTFLYSEKYLAGVSVFCVYSAVLILRCTYWGMILNASGNTKFILYSSIFSLVLNIILNYIFFMLFGFIGPAVATFIAQLTVNLLQLTASARLLNVKFSKIFPWRELFKYTCVNLIFAVIFYIVKIVLPLEKLCGNIIEAIIIGLIWMATMFFTQKKSIVNNWNKLNGG